MYKGKTLMSFDFTNLFHLGFLLCALLCVAGHFISVFIKAGWAKFALPACVAVHILMIFCLLFGGAELDFTVAVFAVSVLLYTAMFYIKHSLDLREARGEEEESDL